MLPAAQAAEHTQHGFHAHPCVEQEALLPDVDVLKLAPCGIHLFHVLRLIGFLEAVAVYVVVQGCGAGETGANLPCLVIFSEAEERELILRHRARSDNAHIPQQDIQQLGQLVQLQPADDSSPREDSVRFGTQGGLGALPRLAQDAHGAELVHDKRLVVPADSFRPIKHRPRIGQLDADDGHDPERQGKHDRKAG